MVDFLTPEWLDALDAAARADKTLADTTRELDLVFEQRVHDSDDATPFVYQVAFDRGTTPVSAGATRPATVTFTQDRATAAAIASGTASAQRAFMTGQLRVGGDLRALVEAQDAMAAIGDVFASVRQRTDFGLQADGA